MGWLFCITGKNITRESINRARTIHPVPLFYHQTSQLYIAGGGLKQTCLSSLAFEGQRNQGWLVCGLGISNNGAGMHFLNSSDWNEIFSKSSPELDLLNGHFAAITWQDNKLSLFIDSLGLRELYIANQDKEIVISSRLDWLCNYFGDATIDFKRFGSKWLCCNQLSLESAICSITRLGPGARAQISPDSLVLVRPRYSLPKIESNNSLDWLITEFATFPQRYNQHIVFCLSGGIDARALLSVLLLKPKSEFDVCIFGHPENPDVRIAKEIVKKFNLRCRYFEEAIPEAETCLRLMRDFVAQTECIAPASDGIRLRFYNEVCRQNEVLIDGGYGEMARCWLYNRLLIYGKKAYHLHDTNKIISYLMLSRADIFSDEINRTMKEGIEEDMNELWNGLPHKDLQYFADLLAICLFLPNTLSPEQSRIDNLLLSYMPFAQAGYLSKILKTDINQRKNGIFLRRLILKNCPDLSRFPLVTILGDSIIYPFSLTNKIAIKALARIEQVFGLSFSDRLKARILRKLKSYILDTISLREVRSYGAYNLANIEKIVRRFYEGDEAYANELMWWLTFELWRQSLSLK